MTDTVISAVPAPKVKIFAEADPLFSWPAADAVICAMPSQEEAAPEREDIVWRWSQGGHLPSVTQICVVDEGLTAAAKLCADTEGLFVVPRAEVRRVSRRYSFAAAAPGEGFSTYRLDPASVSAFVATDSGREYPLADWLRQAGELGFSEIWLHGSGAASARQGFPVEILARAHRLAPQLCYWLSGGGCALEHFETIAPMPGLAALVVPGEDLAGLDPEAIRQALDLRHEADGLGVA